MSQRKEKYLRGALEQYEGIARDVDHLMSKTGLMDRRLGQVWERQAATGREMDVLRQCMSRSELDVRRERGRKRREAARRQRLALAVGLALVAIVAVACVIRVLFGASTAQAAGPTATEKTGMAVTVISTEDAAVPLQGAEEGEDPLEAEKIEAALLAQGYLSDAVPLSYTEQDLLRTTCEEYGVPYTFVLAVIERETQFQNIEGDGGAAVGYMQVQPKQHGDRMDRLGADNLRDPAQNFRVGVNFLAELLTRYEDPQKALMAYNMGPTAASRLWEEGVVTSEYSRAVMERADFWDSALE